jgi:alkylation response protein AidB-like acyl-CoA dehydrogenase
MADERSSMSPDLAVSLERALAELLPISHLVRAAEADKSANDERDSSLLSLGLLEAALPEAVGGLGLDARAISELWFVAGRHLLPMPLREEALVLAPLLALKSSEGWASECLARLRVGTIHGGGRVLLYEPPSEGVVRVWCSPRSEMIALLGPERAMLYQRPSTSAVRGIDLGQGLASFDLGSQRPVSCITGDVARALWHRWHVAVLAEITGAAHRALELSIGYARTRQQFGRPIAQFQAVSHMLADMRTEVDASRALVARTISLLDEGAPDFVMAVARYAVPQAARAVCELAIQVHGGTGFTWEYGLHLFYRRVLQLQAALGGADGAALALGRRYLAELRGSANA